jgi:hypothetical protein
MSILETADQLKEQHSPITSKRKWRWPYCFVDFHTSEFKSYVKKRFTDLIVGTLFYGAAIQFIIFLLGLGDVVQAYLLKIWPFTLYGILATFALIVAYDCVIRWDEMQVSMRRGKRIVAKSAKNANPNFVVETLGN